MQHALLSGYIKINPCAGLHIPPGLPSRRRPLPSSDELKICAEHFEGFDFLPFFLLFTGCRISEALALRFDDIDRKSKTAYINKHLIHISNQPILENVTKTENSKRAVLLLDRVLEHMPKGSGDGLIFHNEDGGPYTRRQFRTQWAKYKERYGVTFTPHQLRHGFATILYEAGVQERDAMELMGHSDITLTRQIYTHIRAERKSETLDRLNDFSF